MDVSRLEDDSFDGDGEHSDVYLEINIMFERIALEICVACIGRKKDWLSLEGREMKQKQRKRIEKSASLLVYLMTSIELTHLITHFSVAVQKI